MAREPEAAEAHADVPDITLRPDDAGWSMELSAYLADRPGSLARLARSVARHGANITHFVFNRSESPNRVRLSANVQLAATAGALADRLQRAGVLVPQQEAETSGVPDPDAILTMRARLVDEPGSLAAFAELLAAHRANVIFMEYDRRLAQGQCRMSMAAPTAIEVRGAATISTSSTGAPTRTLTQASSG